MPYRPIKTKIFLKFLKHYKCYEVNQKSGGSHSYWKRPGLTRRIVVRKADKEIPPLHIKTNLFTLGLRYEDLEKFIEEN